VARAKKWLGVVAGLALPAAGVGMAEGLAAVPVAAGRSADVLVCQQLPRSRASETLNDAIDNYRKGDYEAADRGLKQAQAGSADLTPLQQQELAQFTKSNDAAMQRRAEAADLVRQAEKAEREGRGLIAADLAQKALANQFAASADKEKAQAIVGRVRGTPAGATAGVAPAAGKDKLMVARQLLAEGDLDAAEQVAREADRAGVKAGPGEESPKKLLETIAKTREDAGALLTLARAAVTRSDLDRAEALAKASKKIEPIYAVHLWGDSPSNVLHDVQVARDKKMAADKEAAKKPVVAKQPPPPKDNPTPTVPPKETVAANKPDVVPPPPPAPDAAKVTQATEQARQLLMQGRKSLKDGQLDKAEECAHKADGLKPNLGWWEDDTPAKLLADVQAARTAKAGTAKADAKTPAADPRALLRDAHKAFDDGKLDEAIALAQRAKAAPGAKDCWGLFDFDTPDKLVTEVNKARAKQNELEAAKLLVDGRKLLEQAQKDDAHRGELLDQAQKTALKADTLRNGTYSVWELGDRPSKLLADIDTERKKGRTKVVPPVPPIGAAVAANEGAGRWPAGPSDDPRVPQARRMMNEARTAARAGNKTAALAAIDTVEQMNLPADKLGSDSPAAVRRELALATPAGAAPAPAVQPSTPTPLDRTGTGQARALVAEARQLQLQGRLLEARTRLLDAQKLSAVFGPEEDRPEKALLDLAGLARRQIDRLESQADDAVHHATAEPQKYAEAEEKLGQAEALARGFQLDTYLLDKKLTWVRQTRGSTAVAQVNPDPVQRVGAQTHVGDGGPQAQGQQMLAQARLEVHAGNTAAARRIVEQVYASNYGLKTEAENMLRSIDVEEYEQKRNEQKRTYEAGKAAFDRGDFVHAGNILRMVDVKLLDPERQARMKELMRDPQMQPDTSVETVAQAGTSGPGVPPSAGSAHVDDSRETTYLQQVDAMRQVKFQKMRDQELDSEKSARKLAEIGDTDQAIQVLQEYLSRLPNSGLDPDKTALLRRPVEAKLQQYQTLDAQKKIKGAAEGAFKQARYNHEQKSVAEENKQLRMKELMDKSRALYKQAKYSEAEMYAMQAQELDPDDAAAGAAVQMSRMQRNIVRYRSIKQNSEDSWLEYANEAQDMGPIVNPDDPLKYGKDRWKIARERKGVALGQIGPLKSERDREIEHHLDTIVSLSFRDVPLGKVFDDLMAEQAFTILPDQPALNAAGITLNEPVTFKVDNMTLKSALKNLLHNMNLTYVIEDEALKITTPENARGKCVLVPYQVTELVITVPDATPQPMLPNQIQNAAVNPGQASTASPVTGPFSLGNGSSVGSPGGSGFGASGGLSGQNWEVKKNVSATREDQLIQLIQNTISPKSWASLGGQGTIDYFPLTMTLVINQTPDIQEQIADLLAALRRLQDAEVAVEIRLISIAEGFFERIGVDFNINIVNDKGTQKFQPQITSGQFKPAGFINDFTPSNFISGLTPAGSFTSDLGIPIKNSSFGMAIPPFGGFPNAPGANGGIDLGLAFLSDIQVYMFLEAAQGDQRTNVMQAPKITLFNGQLSTLTISDQQFFVTSASVTVVNGQPVFIPNNQLFPTGAQINVQAVISADRRFVRMNFSGPPVGAGGNGGAGGGITLTNLASAVVPLFPIVQLVPTVLDGGIQTSPVAFTQFFQQPVFNTVSVVTTVMVPDGGTVLLGGLKRLSEGRNEFGPPVLSKIPYLDRLFRNVGYGREVENLMMMVTPRIIINEEEELRQTNVGREQQAGQ
jgi:type II secretory pathway component GspD/PulD (secretin)/tetratricopeptide (TPR) repeat protein